MNKDICRICKMKLVFFQDLNNNEEDFCCLSNIKYLKHWFKNISNVSLFYLKNKKWKQITKNKESVEILKHIDDLLKKYNIDKIRLRDDICICPYYIEHQLSEWNKENES